MDVHLLDILPATSFDVSVLKPEVFFRKISNDFFINEVVFRKMSNDFFINEVVFRKISNYFFINEVVFR